MNKLMTHLLFSQEEEEREENEDLLLEIFLEQEFFLNLIHRPIHVLIKTL